MILRGSYEWKIFLRDLKISIEKSNRDVLCLECWEILKYDRNLKHKSSNPTHITSILTSKEYGNEMLILELAKRHNKLKKEGGKTFIENPYKRREKRGRPSNNPLLYEEIKKR